MPAVPPNFIEPYLAQKVRHPYYDESVEMAEALEIHADGDYPGDLIEQRRPAESREIHEYRKKIFEPITKPVFSKVYNSLMKIRKSSDWMLSFKNDVVPARIAEDETPERYLMDKFPKHHSITNWMFSIAFKKYLCDANALVFTFPLSMEVADNEYLKPYPRIFDSDEVIDYKEGKYFVLEDEEKIHYESDGQYYTDGRRFWVIQPDVIQVFHEMSQMGRIVEVMNIENPLGYIPIRWMYGQNVEMNAYTMLNESRISSVVPMLNEALREYSDLQAEIVMHIHSTMWSMQPQQCKTCRGIGSIPRENSAPVQCPGCSGIGLAPLNPFEHLVLAPPRPGEPSIPTPPMGYVQKDTEIARLQQERIQQHIYAALSAINMEFLAEVPLSQSGTAKQVDREELNSFVHSIAEDVVRIIDGVSFDCCAWRYSGMTDDIRALVPYIPVPDQFDMVNGSTLINELQQLTTAQAAPAIINAAQIELINKKFNDEGSKQSTILQLQLDPFSGSTVDELASAKTFDAITQEAFVVHNNITHFVRRALEENPDFGQLGYTDKMAILNGYATEQIGLNANA